VAANIRNHAGNANKVVVAGHSAGGHLAALVTLDGSYLSAAAARRNVALPAGFLKGTISLSGIFSLAGLLDSPSPGQPAPAGQHDPARLRERPGGLEKASPSTLSGPGTSLPPGQRRGLTDASLVRQTQRLRRPLKQKGSPITRLPSRPGSPYRTYPERGTDRDPTTRAIRDFVRKVTGA